MRKIIVAVGLIISFAFTGNDTGKKEIDKALVGVWKGSEKNQQIEGAEKHWIVNRSKDGTFFIMFTLNEDCHVETSIEKGKWWTDKGKFYEYHEDSNLTDVYDYQVINPQLVKFKSVQLLGETNSNYEFEDYRLE